MSNAFEIWKENVFIQELYTKANYKSSVKK